jgi:uncharacterized membrane protein
MGGPCADSEFFCLRAGEPQARAIAPHRVVQPREIAIFAARHIACKTFPRRRNGMYTKAAIAKHPIHPMLIVFPVALYAVTVVALIVHAGTNDPFWYRAAFWTNLGAVVMASVAAVPGLIDLLNVPAKSRARATGIRHATFNVLALALFVISDIIIGRHWYGHGVGLPDAAPLVLGVIGLSSTLIAGALGWTLVQTHHVGVKPTERAGLGMRAPEDVDDLDELVIEPHHTTAPLGSPVYTGRNPMSH